MKVCVFQWPNGALARSLRPFEQRPRSRGVRPIALAGEFSERAGCLQERLAVLPVRAPQNRKAVRILGAAVLADRHRGQRPELEPGDDLPDPHGRSSRRRAGANSMPASTS